MALLRIFLIPLVLHPTLVYADWFSDVKHRYLSRISICGNAITLYGVMDATEGEFTNFIRRCLQVSPQCIATMIVKKSDPDHSRIDHYDLEDRCHIHLCYENKSSAFVEAVAQICIRPNEVFVRPSFLAELLLALSFDEQERNRILANYTQSKKEAFQAQLLRSATSHPARSRRNNGENLATTTSQTGNIDMQVSVGLIALLLRFQILRAMEQSDCSL